MGAQSKKKTFALSLTPEEQELLLLRAEEHGFRDRNEYVLALVAADIALGLEVTLVSKKKALRNPSFEAMAAESQALYDADKALEDAKNKKKP